MEMNMGGLGTSVLGLGSEEADDVGVGKQPSLKFPLEDWKLNELWKDQTRCVPRTLSSPLQAPWTWAKEPLQASNEHMG